MDTPITGSSYISMRPDHRAESSLPGKSKTEGILRTVVRSKVGPGAADFLHNLFLHIRYCTAIGGVPVSLCVKRVRNHIFLKINVIDNYKCDDFFMTFCQKFIN